MDNTLNKKYSKCLDIYEESMDIIRDIYKKYPSKGDIFTDSELIFFKDIKDFEKAKKDFFNRLKSYPFIVLDYGYIPEDEDDIAKGCFYIGFDDYI